MISALWKLMFGQRENQYAGLVAASQAASRARFHTWEFEPETKTLDLDTATVDQLRAALSDCWRCTAVEYPETQQGTYWAMDRIEDLKAAILRRFPNQAEVAIRTAGDAASWASYAAHGGPRPKTTN